MSLAVPIRDVTRGQGIAFCRPLRSRPWRQAARLSWSGLLGRAAADPSLGRVTFQTGRVVTFLSGVYSLIVRARKKGADVPLAETALRQFSRFGVIFVAGIALTGLVNAWHMLDGGPDLARAYDRVLFAKV